VLPVEATSAQTPTEVVARVGRRLRDASVVTSGPRRPLATRGKHSHRGRAGASHVKILIIIIVFVLLWLHLHVRLYT
jgi:hypothetical protein